LLDCDNRLGMEEAIPIENGNASVKHNGKAKNNADDDEGRKIFASNGLNVIGFMLTTRLNMPT